MKKETDETLARALREAVEEALGGFPHEDADEMHALVYGDPGVLVGILDDTIHNICTDLVEAANDG